VDEPAEPEGGVDVNPLVSYAAIAFEAGQAVVAFFVSYG